MQNKHPPTDRQKLSPLRIASYAGFAVGSIVLVCLLALLLFTDPLVNRFIKPRVTQAFAEAYPAYSIRIAGMNYSVFKNRFGFDSVALSAVDSTFSSNIGPFSVSGIGWMHLLWGGSLAPNDFAGSVVEAQDIMLNLPQYELHCERLRASVQDSEIVVEGLKLHVSGDEQLVAESKFRKTRYHLGLPHARVTGIACLELLQGNHDAHDFANSVVNAQDILLNFPQEQYGLRCRRLRVSVPDSELVAESLELHPLADDEQFFGESKFRRTRFGIVTSRCSVMGLACLELLQGKNYRTRSVQIHDVFLDVLINKDKYYAKDTLSPPMPNEILSSIQGTLQVDSLSIMNGYLKYGERFAVSGKPALITLDSMQVLAEGIANHGAPGAALVIHAQGTFMKAATMKMFMSIPVASPEFSYQYAGSLSRMDLRALNPFLETAEQMRIKAGVLQAATFEINVVSGHASGNVRAVYKDLFLAAINKHTGSEKGFFDGIASFVANTFKIRGTNVQNKSGSTKVGGVKYARKGDEFFLEFTWFALRSGVGNIVGF
jgi:hypothetical protein